MCISGWRTFHHSRRPFQGTAPESTFSGQLFGCPDFSSPFVVHTISPVNLSSISFHFCVLPVKPELSVTVSPSHPWSRLFMSSSLDSPGGSISPRCVPTPQAICRFHHEVASPGASPVPPPGLTSLLLYQHPGDSTHLSLLFLIPHFPSLHALLSRDLAPRAVPHILQKLPEDGGKRTTVFSPVSRCDEGLAGHAVLGGDDSPEEFGRLHSTVPSHPVLVFRSPKPLQFPILRVTSMPL